MTDTSTYSGASPPLDRPRASTPLSQPMGGVRRLGTRVRRAVLSRRRPLAALMAACAVAAGLRVLAPPPPAAAPVLVAAHDLAAGAQVSADDVETVAWPADAVPDGAAALDEVVGRVLAAPLRAGEPVTDVRVGGVGFAATEPGLTALPIRLPDAGVADLLGPGDRIDLIATDPADGTAETIAEDVVVLVVPARDGDGSGIRGESGAASGGRLVVVAVSDVTTKEVAAASVSRYVSIAFSR